MRILAKEKTEKDLLCLSSIELCSETVMFPWTENYWNKTFTQKQSEHADIMLIMTCLQRKGKGNVLQARMGYWTGIHD